MVKNLLILIIFFYILVLLQTSFLAYFPLRGYILNLTLIAIIFINLFEKPSEKLGLISAFFGGLFLDIFSKNFIGFYILILLGISIFIKIILRKYVRISISKKS